MLAAIHRKVIDRCPHATYNIHPYTDNAHVRDSSYADMLRQIEATAGVAAKAGGAGEGVALSRPVEGVVESASERTDDEVITTTVIHTPEGDLTSITRSPHDQPARMSKHLVESDEDLDKYMSLPYEPPVFDVSGARGLCEAVGDRGLVFMGIPETTERVAPLFHYEDFCARTLVDLPSLKRVCDWTFERCMENTRLLVRACAGMDCVFHAIGPEYCTPPMVAPSVFAQLVTPYLRKQVEAVHEAGMLLCVHCHGRVREVLAEMLKAEVDLLEPIEPPPQGDITLKELLDQGSGRMCLMGYVQDQDFYTAHSGYFTNWVEEIARLVDGGTGYIMTPTCTPFDLPCTDTYKRNYLEWLRAADRLL